ncbi:MAG: hypothetical protein ACYDD9_14185 [Acidithiobacillus sp.]
MTTADILQRLDGVRKMRCGWIARCPAHDDRRPSLAISEGRDGRVLLRCWAGCELPAICNALGLRIADLFASTDYRKPEAPRSAAALEREIRAELALELEREAARYA